MSDVPGPDESTLPDKPRGQPQLQPGQVLALRFRIISFIAHGGMGDVYVAEDMRVGGTVALKTIRHTGLLTSDVLERFRREVSSAKKVTHPNVCRIYDLHHHAPMRGSGNMEPPNEIVFYTMELLTGQTVSDAIRRYGKLSRARVLAIVQQVVAGLEAIHAAGIIHRDLKSSNIIVKFGPIPDAVEVKITDFGLARNLEPEASAGSYQTATGALIGTPEYMAPEVLYQLGPANKASDIYSLGVVVYQMLTGSLPSSPEQEASGTGPAPPSTLVRIPRRWDAAILRCLQRDPALRFRSASEFLHALSDGQPAQKLLLAAAVLVVSALAVFLMLKHTGRLVAKHQFIAVLGFKNLSGNSRAGDLSATFTTGLINELRVSGHVDVVPGEDVSRLKLDLKIPDQQSYSRATLERIQQNTGATVVLLGSFLTSGTPDQNITLYVIAQSTTSGETLASIKEQGPASALLDLISRATDDLRSQMHLPGRSPEGERLARSSLPQNSEALRLYADGLEMKHTYDLMGARDLFKNAIAAESDYAPARAELAETLSDLGYDAEAEQQITAALKLSKPLPREQQLLIEGEYYDITHDWNRAIERFRALLDFYPENIYYGELLLGVEDPSEQMKTAEELRKLPSPLNEDPRIDIWEARAAYGLSQYGRERVVAARGAAKARERGARGQLAEALVQEAIAELALGHPEQSRAFAFQAKQIDDSLHDQVGSATCLRLLGAVSLDLGDLTKAWELYSAAFDTGHRIGSIVAQARGFDALGDVRLAQGELDEAYQLYANSVALWREENNSINSAIEELGVGRVRYRQAHLNEARREFQQALTTFTDLKEDRDRAVTLGEMAKLLLNAGEMGDAVQEIHAMLNIQGTLQANAAQGGLLLDEAEVARERGLFEEAQQRCRDAARQFAATGQKGNLARANTFFALLLSDEGRPAEAGKLAKQAAAEFAREGDSPDETVARAVGALSMLGNGSTANARLFLAPAVHRKDKMQDVLAADFVNIAEARVLGASGDMASARATLRDVIDSCARTGLVRDRLEAMLTLSELEHRPDATLAAEATQRGFARIARRALQISAR